MDGKSDKFSERKFVILTKLESDDMYREDVIEKIQSCALKERGGLVCNKGYVLFYDTPSLYRRIKWEIGKLLTKLKLK